MRTYYNNIYIYALNYIEYFESLVWSPILGEGYPYYRGLLRLSHGGYYIRSNISGLINSILLLGLITSLILVYIAILACY